MLYPKAPWWKGQLVMSLLEGPNNNPEGSSNGMPNTGGGGGGSSQPGAGSCPEGQIMHPTNGCRYPGDFPCPPGQCRDVVSKVCRTPGHNEKVRESDGSDVRGNCRQRDPGAGGGGGGAGGGGAAAGPKVGAPGAGGGPGANGQCPPGWPANVCAMFGLGTGPGSVGSMLEGNLKQLLGGGTRYTPEVMQRLAAQSKSQTEAQVANATASANEDAAARGVFTSGGAAEQATAIRAAGDARFSADNRQYQIEKVNADFEDKLAGIDRAQKWLDSLRTYAAQLDQTQADREKTDATIRLGYAQLAQQKELFIKQLASNKELLSMQLNSAEFLAGMRLQMGL